MRRGTILLAAAALSLGACAGKPLQITCPGFANLLVDLPPGAVVDDIDSDQGWPGRGDEVFGLSDDKLAQYMAAQFTSETQWLRPQFDNMVGVMRVHGEAHEPGTTRPYLVWASEPILMLSGGGQWGAFGASYLKEVHATTPGGLPNFRIVTGVSTGAMQSLFFGNWRDPASREAALASMKAAYDIKAESDIVDRGGLAALATRGALAQLGPLHQRIIARLCPEGASTCPMVEAFKTSQQGASEANLDFVLVGMIDAESGKFKYVSLNALVNDQYRRGPERDRPQRAAQCLAGAVLASSAMPGYYQQLQVGDQQDGYRTYIDGGARASVFQAMVARAFSPAVLTKAMQAAYPANFETAAIAVAAPAEGPTYVVRNGPTSVVTIDQKDKAWSGLSAMQRAYAIMVNQSEVNSIAAIRLLQPKGDLFLATADGYAKFGDGTTRCEKSSEEVMFDPVFMKCLFELGVQKAKITRPRGGPWISVSEIKSGE